MLVTKWSEDALKQKTWKEYPRPQMQRSSFLNLNGMWDFRVENEHQTVYEGTILVPFSPEAFLSGIQRRLEPFENAIYRRQVTLPSLSTSTRWILHFGAVDQEAEVRINGVLVGSHMGGFLPFSFDISDYLTQETFTLEVHVRDITDMADRQTGKQRLEHGGIFYTPQSGIWQTVWLEEVPVNHLKDIFFTPDLDQKKVECVVLTSGPFSSVDYEIMLKGTLLQKGSSSLSSFHIDLQTMIPWTPESPTLYEVTLTMGLDQVQTYFGMRKFERKKDESGISRFYLNNEPYFLSGVLDQGYWPDGLLTPPADDAMVEDIATMKAMGFNLLRKHIKIEPLRWYYHCDRLGIIVWQDFVSGSERKDIFFHGGLGMAGIPVKDNLYALFGRKSKAGREQFLIEALFTVQLLKNVVSIATWVPFNEAWGQFDARSVENMVRGMDSSRLIDHASGWHDQHGGDYVSKHIYFQKIHMTGKNKGKHRILALTEFGGYSWMIPHHSFREDKVFGYRKYEDQTTLTSAVVSLYQDQILPEVERGLSVLVYTQLSDVEEEVNGFLSYDRQVVKIAPETMKQVHESLFQAFHRSLKQGGS